MQIASIPNAHNQLDTARKLETQFLTPCFASLLTHKAGSHQEQVVSDMQASAMAEAVATHIAEQGTPLGDTILTALIKADEGRS